MFLESLGAGTAWTMGFPAFLMTAWVLGKADLQAANCQHSSLSPDLYTKCVCIASTVSGGGGRGVEGKIWKRVH